MSNSVRTHRRQPTRLYRPWDSPGKSAGVGCHCHLQCMKVKKESEVVQSCPTLSDPMDRSLPGSSVHGIFQARVLEWGANTFSNLSSSIPQLICCIIMKKLLNPCKFPSSLPQNEDSNTSLTLPGGVWHLITQRRASDIAYMWSLKRGIK